MLATNRIVSSESPTRTIRIDEAESRVRSPSARTALSHEALSSRPRSNPRTRTPMRMDEDRRTNIESQGSVLSRETAVTSSKSRKQGPGRRKIRRWENDQVEMLDLRPSTRKVLQQAREDSHLYREVYDPQDHCCSAWKT